MAFKVYHIREFTGLDQSADEARLDPGATPDARNMDTAGGSLAVAKGYVRHLDPPVPGEGDPHRLYVWRDLVTYRYIVAAGTCLYAWVSTDEVPAWRVIYDYGAPFAGARLDFLETKIGEADWLIVACGERQLVKWDGVSESAVLFGDAARVSDIPVNFLALHYSRLFAAGDPDHPSRLYWSATPGDGRTIENWALEAASESVSGGHVEVGSTATDPIVGIRALSNQLVIFKRDSIYRLLGDRPGNFRVLRVDAGVEQMSHAGCAVYGDVPFWLTKAGLHYFDGQSARRMANARYIREVLETADLTDIRAAAHRDVLYFAVKIGGEDAVICYDAVRRAYMVRDGFACHDLCACAGTLYLLDGARRLCRFGEGDGYDGAPIHAYWRTPLTDLSDKGAVKGLREMRLRARQGGEAILLVKAYAGGNAADYRVLLPEGPYDVLDLPLKNEGRTFAFLLENEAGGRWALDGGLEVLLEMR